MNIGALVKNTFASTAKKSAEAAKPMEQILRDAAKAAEAGERGMAKGMFKDALVISNSTKQDLEVLRAFSQNTGIHGYPSKFELQTLSQARAHANSVTEAEQVIEAAKQYKAAISEEVITPATVTSIAGLAFPPVELISLPLLSLGLFNKHRVGVIQEEAAAKLKTFTA